MKRNSGYVNVPMVPLERSWIQEEDITEEEEETLEEAKMKLERWIKKKNNTELITAILNSDLENVKRLLDGNVSPLVRCQQSMATGLHLAALKGNEQILGELLETCKLRGLVLTASRATDREGRRPHHLAVAAGQLRALKALLRMDPELLNSQVVKDPKLDKTVKEDMLDSFLHDHSSVSNILPDITEKSTALHIASKHNHLKILDYLISLKADVNIKDSEGLTPLDVAGICHCPAELRRELSRAVSEMSSLTEPELLDYNTATDSEVLLSPTSSFVFGTPPADSKRSRASAFYVESLSTTMNVISALIKGGAALSQERRKKTTPLHVYIEKDDIKSIQEFLSSGFELADKKSLMNTMDDNGMTPVHLAMERHLLKPLKMFFKIDGKAVNYQDRNGRTPLHIAVQTQWLSGIEICLEHNADIGLATTLKETVLHYAAKIKDPAILNSLLERTSKSVVNQRDIFGYTALFRSIEAKNEDCVRLLLDFCTPRKYLTDRTSLLHVAVKTDVENILSVLQKKLAFKFDFINQPDMNGFSPLHLAVRENCLNSLRYMLSLPDSLVDFEAEQHGDLGGNILHIAARVGNHEALEVILSHGFAERLISKRDKKNGEPLVIAAKSGQAECVKVLLKNGANIAAKDNITDRTALELIHCNIPHSGRLLDDLLDCFMTKSDDRQDSADFRVTVSYKCLLADSKVNERQLGVVDAVLKCGHERLRQRLFLHPVVESFLYFKWSQLKIFYRLLVVAFFIHIFALTAHAITTYVYPTPLHFNWPWRTVVLLMNTLIFFLELLFLRSDSSYWIDSETWVKWSVIGSSTVVCLAGTAEWTRYLTSVAVLLAWLQLLFLVARNPRWGLRVLMFFEVAANVFQVLSTFVFLILGFAFAFLILFNGQHPFTNIGTTIAKILIMMVELDYGGVYGSDKPVANNTIEILGRLMYLGFVILVVMVLTNLIVGMSVSDIAELENQGRSKRIAKQASFLVLFEKICYGNWCSPLRNYMRTYRSAPNSTIVWVNKRRNEENPLPGHLRRSIYQTAMDSDCNSEVDDLHSKIENLTEDVHHIIQAVNELKNTISAYSDNI